MTNITFLYENNLLIGFNITGHATVSEDDFEGKLVCSAISSAAYLTANTITEIVGAKAKIVVNDGGMKLKLTEKIRECQVTLMGLKLHLEELSKQFRNYCTVYSEV